MWLQWTVWLNRIGLLFDLMSFWLVAPEFIGEQRLKDLEEKIKRRLVDAAGKPTSTAYRVLEFLALASVPVLCVMLAFLLVGVDRLLSIPVLGVVAAIVLFVGVVILPLTMAFPYMGRFVVLRGSIRLLKYLRGKERMRHLLFWCGAALFVLGIGFQFVGTF